jgi:hypothetical protein
MYTARWMLGPIMLFFRSRCTGYHKNLTLLRYSRACAQHSDFLNIVQLLIQNLLKHGYVAPSEWHMSLDHDLIFMIYWLLYLGQSFVFSWSITIFGWHNDMKVHISFQVFILAPSLLSLCWVHYWQI